MKKQEKEIIFINFQEVPEIKTNCNVQRLSTEFAIFNSKVGVIFEIGDRDLGAFMSNLKKICK